MGALQAAWTDKPMIKDQMTAHVRYAAVNMGRAATVFGVCVNAPFVAVGMSSCVLDLRPCPCRYLAWIMHVLPTLLTRHFASVPSFRVPQVPQELRMPGARALRLSSGTRTTRGMLSSAASLAALCSASTVCLSPVSLPFSGFCCSGPLTTVYVCCLTAFRSFNPKCVSCLGLAFSHVCSCKRLLNTHFLFERQCAASRRPWRPWC